MRAIREVPIFSVRHIVLSVFLFLCVFSNADAALLYIDPDAATLYRGDTVTLGVRIDTDENECINVVNGVIKYSPDIRAVDVSIGDSILNVWLEDPVINEEAHTITFVGGLPGGYCGRIAGDPSLTNILVELVFRSPGLSIGANDKNPQVWVDASSEVLLHDGLGTKAQLRTEGITLTLLDSAGATVDDSWKNRVQEDDTPPSDFSITLANLDTAFDGQYFITFTSQDKQSGIDHYEVMEEPFAEFYAFKWGRVDAPWKTTESPYVLVDQTLNSTIRVKAIDKAGNETIAVYVPEEAMRSTSEARIMLMVSVGLVVLILLAIVGFFIWRRKQKLVLTYDHETSL